MLSYTLGSRMVRLAYSLTLALLFVGLIMPGRADAASPTYRPGTYCSTKDHNKTHTTKKYGKVRCSRYKNGQWRWKHVAGSKTTPRAKSSSTLTHFKYNHTLKHYYTTKTFTTGAKDGIAASATKVSRKTTSGKLVCANYTLQAFSDTTGKQLGQTYTEHCSNAEGDFWKAPKGKFFVLVTVLKPTGATYVATGTIYYHG